MNLTAATETVPGAGDRDQLPLPGMTWREANEWERRRREYEERWEFVDAMGAWLAGQGFEWFATWTFRPREDGEQHTLEWCKRTLDRYLEELGRRAGYTRAQVRLGRALAVFVAWERHKSGAWHAHGLVRRTRDLAVWDAIDLAHTRMGIARVFPVEGEREARYVAKYTSKGPETWNLHGDGSPDAQLGLPFEEGDQGQSTAGRQGTGAAA